MQAKSFRHEDPGVTWRRRQRCLHPLFDVPRNSKAIHRETFGERLARLRTAAGFTQRELADELGISQRMVAYYETQEEHPFTQLVPALTEALGVSADELFALDHKKAVRPANQRLWRRFRRIEQLPPKERRHLLSVIDAVLDRDKLSRGSTAL